MLDIHLDIPKLELRIDIDAVLQATGEGLAADAQARLERGIDAKGGAIPGPKGGGQALRRTGTLLGSIRYKKLSKGGGRVSFTGRHDAKRTNSRIASYQWLRGISLIAATPAVDKLAGELAQAEVDRQVANGQAGLGGT